jgi:hypothetical protein
MLEKDGRHPCSHVWVVVVAIPLDDGPHLLGSAHQKLPDQDERLPTTRVVRVVDERPGETEVTQHRSPLVNLALHKG